MEPQKGKLWIYLSMQNSQGLSLDYPLVGRDMEIPVTTLLGMNLSTIPNCQPMPGSYWCSHIGIWQIRPEKIVLIR